MAKKRITKPEPEKEKEAGTPLAKEEGQPTDQSEPPAARDSGIPPGGLSKNENPGVPPAAATTGSGDKVPPPITAGLASEPAPDPFDPEKLRLSQRFDQLAGVKKHLLTVPVRKPSNEWWVRVHPDENYRIQTAVVELKEDRETYLVDPTIWPDLATEATFGPRALFTAVNRQGVLFLWPVKLPGPDGKRNVWNDSALEAAQMASEKWVKVQANMSLGAYDVFEAVADLPAPEWPNVSFRQILEVAFKDNYIRSLDHPILRRLRGET